MWCARGWRPRDRPGIPVLRQEQTLVGAHNHAIMLRLFLFFGAAGAFVLPFAPLRATRRTVPHASHARSSPPTLAESPRRRPAAYELYSEDEIAQIHEKADAIFAILDRNGDGEISEEEFRSHLLAAGYAKAAVVELYETLDSNPRNGALSQSELREAFVRYPPLLEAPGLGELGESERAAVYEEADATFAALDLDGNGSLSLEELQEHFAGVEGPTYSSVAVERIFAKLDTDANGEISLAEFRGGYARYRAMRLALGSGFATGGLQL